MRTSPAVATVHGLALASVARAAYVWPWKYDWIEDIYSLQGGIIRNSFAIEVSPCSFGGGTARQNAAEWIRVAYHDMATHDAAAGTGGLDASIMFETERDENEGRAFENTFRFFTNFYNSRVSAADLIALGVVASTALCGGPKLPFRVGRVDAVDQGPWGVPKPDQDLAHHTMLFARQGFTAEEMITMVACGHTLGGIHDEDFPDIVGVSNPGPENVTAFEGLTADGQASRFIFDNHVVTEYLDGSSPNPLVSGHNDTTNSDKRVFGADGNKTMTELANPDTFKTRCRDIFTRMIDTVPREVVLTEPIEPIDIKPYVDKMALNADGTISFVGRVRIRLDGRSNRDANDMAVSLLYTDRTGARNSVPIVAVQARLRGGQSWGIFGELFQWFDFSAALPADSGISKFDIHLGVPSTGAATVFDNQGQGYPVQDAVLFQQDQSCLDTTDRNGTFNVEVVAAVRTEHAGLPVAVDMVHKVPRPGVVFDALVPRQAPMAKTGQNLAGYELFRVDIPLEISGWSTTFDVVLGSGSEARKVEFQRTGGLQNVCETLG